MVTMTSSHKTLAKRLGATIRLLRTRKGWKQDVLAREAGYGSRSAIASVEAGWVLPSVDKLYDLAAALGVPPGVLLDTDVSVLEPLPKPLANWSTRDRRAFVRSMRRLIAEVEDTEATA